MVGIGHELETIDEVVLGSFDKAYLIRGYETANIRRLLKIVLKAVQFRYLKLELLTTRISGGVYVSKLWDF